MQELLQQSRLREVQRQREADNLRAIIGEQQARIRELEHDLQVIREQPLVLPDDPPLERHRYGLLFITLAVTLASRIGLRASEQALIVFFDWLKVEVKIPAWTTLRFWMLRLGVAVLKAPVEDAEDWVWLTDHSVQIGQEKALVVLGTRASQVPTDGTSLRHENVRLLHLEVRKSWTKDDVSASYLKLEATAGAPRAVVTDGDSALRDGVLALKTKRSDTIAVGDFKHKAANVLKSVVGNSARFASFQTAIGQTRAAIQQTELAHLVPPGKRPKARFMNLAPLLKWAALALWVVEHPDAEARQEIVSQRLEEKLGWIKEYRGEIPSWSACQAIVSQGVTLINEDGLTAKTAAKFSELAATHAICEASREVARRLTEFLQQQAQPLGEGERLPLSTEILESAFGLYKQLEGQHAKGGFTSLLAALGALLVKPTPELIREAFTRVSTKDTRDWIKNSLGRTVPAKRQAAYREFQTHSARETNTTSTA